MKKASLLFCMAFAALGATAQSAHMLVKPVVDLRDAKHALLQHILQQQSVAPAYRSSIAPERLKSSDYFSTYFSTFSNDSAKYTYSGARGSHYDLNQVSFNFPRTPYDYGQPQFSSPFSIGTMDIMSDTALGYTYDTLHHISLTNKTFAMYDGNNNLLNYYNIYTDTTYLRNAHMVNTFDAANRIAVNVTFTGGPLVWDTATRRYFSYNGTGQLTQDSTYAYNAATSALSSKYVYIYNGAGQLTQLNNYTKATAAAPWFKSNEIDLTYYTDGRLQLMLSYDDTGTGLYVSTKDTLGYPAALNYYNYFNEYTSDSTGWSSIYKIKKRVNSAGLPDSINTTERVYFYTSGGVIPQNILFNDNIIYNTSNDPIQHVQYINFGTGGFQLNSVENYYYEIPTGVLGAPQFKNISVYPNPATDNISVLLGDAVAKGDITIRLMNIDGRTIKTQSVPANTAKVQLSLSGITPGTYLISVTDATGYILYIQKLAKQ
ncbi:MAG: T9SS type A sorting domain-containing protein [Taibaiella sp.]|nr:T9SS type A sorting domain-containing protein [Taibaiella sp.]